MALRSIFACCVCIHAQAVAPPEEASDDDGHISDENRPDPDNLAGGLRGGGSNRRARRKAPKVRVPHVVDVPHIEFVMI